jgi:malonyl-CoA/methylmalonyl-CoA synthetase
VALDRAVFDPENWTTARLRIMVFQVTRDLNRLFAPSCRESRKYSMTDSNFFTLLATHMAPHSARVCLETPAGLRYTFSELETETARYANWLGRAGLKRGDRVAVQVEKSPAALFFYLACLRAGLIFVPLNTAYRDLELEHFLDDAAPALVVCAPERVAAIQALATPRHIAHVYTLNAEGRGSLVDAARDAGVDCPPVAVDGDTIAVILYTSGTTGRPKGAMISHANLASNALALHQAWGFRDGDVLLHALPIFHIHGLFVACHTALLNASTMLFLPKFDAKTVIALLPRATVFMGVPTFYTRLLADPAFGKETCRTMRLFTCGSAPLLPQTFHEFEQRTGHTILERYGMTETGMNTSNPLDGLRRPGTVGLPLPGVNVRIVDRQDHEVPAGDTGQLLVKGQNVFKGYWRLPDKTAEEFTSDGYFRTGDLARMDPDGYIAIVGRAKDLIISGGFNIYPKEIEGYLDKLDGVLESAVIGAPHPDFGEAVVAVIVRKPEGAALTEASVITTLKSQIAGFKVPKRVFFVDALPRNTMGKVQKNLLRDQYATVCSR